MTLDQLNEANRLKKLAENSQKLLANFQGLDSGIIFTKRQGSSSEPTNLHDGGGKIPLQDRPEVFAAAASCMMLMKSALEAEAARHAKAFDEFTITA